MKRLSAFSLMIVLVVSMTWVAGCRSPQDATDSSDDTSELLTRAEQPNLNDAYGGYNMKDEEPSFGDPVLAEEFDENASQEYHDVFENDNGIRAMDKPDRAQLFLMITWGNLHRDSTITEWTDWAGSLSVSDGAILLKRTIRFEGNDKILPRTSRDLLEWESMTKPHFDGILVRVFAPAPSISASDVDTMDVDSSAITITFDTDPVDVEFTLDQLPNLNRVITLADGNAVAFKAVYRAPGHCPHGFARGMWFNHPNRNGGNFFGRWATADGKAVGLMKGIYGVNDEGRRVWYGKMILPNGRFEGIMRGTWDNNTNSGGTFRGVWVGRNIRIRGGIAGEWHRSNRCHGGFYRAKWAAANCPL